MHHYLRYFTALFISLLLVSCATTDKTVWDENTADETGIYKFAAWRPDESRQLEAINVLLQEADELIAQQQLNEASDKLERVLRIKPEYAPAWSRLSWLALQMKSPERAVQMAKRSNSFAQENPELQSLNWSFIRAASQELNDEDSYFKANQNIDSLKVF
jgi:Tfp pilus assembly protein PilF